MNCCRGKNSFYETKKLKHKKTKCSLLFWKNRHMGLKYWGCSVCCVWSDYNVLNGGDKKNINTCLRRQFRSVTFLLIRHNIYFLFFYKKSWVINNTGWHYLELDLHYSTKGFIWESLLLKVGISCNDNWLRINPDDTREKSPFSQFKQKCLNQRSSSFCI